MGNPRPTRSFEPGHPRYGGRKVGTPNRATVIQRAPVIRPLAEVLCDEGSFRGSMSEMLESVARDGEQLLDVRLSCANAVARLAPPSSGDPALSSKTTEELQAELDELNRKMMSAATDEELRAEQDKMNAMFEEEWARRARRGPMSPRDWTGPVRTALPDRQAPTIDGEAEAAD
jgi:hypothetical protein